MSVSSYQDNIGSNCAQETNVFMFANLDEVQNILKYERLTKKVPKHQKGAFRARKTLQKLGYNMLEQMGALVFEPIPPPL